MSRKFLILIFGLSLLFLSCNRVATVYANGTVSLAGQTVQVEVAADESTRQLGLGNRSALGLNQGMWFVFDRADNYNFWMKGMRFAIDIIWIDQGRVVDIASNVQPRVSVKDKDLFIYVPKSPANRVLELTAGWAGQHGLKIGDSVEFTSAH